MPTAATAFQTATTAADRLFPVVDVRSQDGITEAQAQFFRENGLLIIRGLLRGEELAALQRETQVLIDKANAGIEHPDYFYKEHEQTGERVPFRVEYVAEKTDAGKSLLAHPFILNTVARLQGRNFVPTWDSVVFKREGMGTAIAWHRDAGEDFGDGKTPIFNVDFYLDRADLTNCVWGVLGSNRWSQADADAAIKALNDDLLTGDFAKHGALPIPMEPGDVLIHDIMVLHGSAPARSHLRRVLYYEFRPAEILSTKGPHIPAYIPRKQQLIVAAQRRRAKQPWAKGEQPYVYQPDAAFAKFPTSEPNTWRYEHMQWWRHKEER